MRRLVAGIALTGLLALRRARLLWPVGLTWNSVAEQRTGRIAVRPIAVAHASKSGMATALTGRISPWVNC